MRPPGSARVGSGSTGAALLLALVLPLGCGRSGEPTAGAGADDDPTSTVRSEPVSGRGSPVVDERSTTTGADPSTTVRPSSSTVPVSPTIDDGGSAGVVTGAQALVDADLALLRGQRVGLIANRASTVGGRRLIDVVAEHPEVEVVALFAPEHGVEADGEAGSEVVDGVDRVTGVPIHSLYGAARAPTPEVLAQLDVVVFDLQDIGARFYTYTATLGLAMQAAARADVQVVVLDRPNPLGGDRPDGPLRGPEAESFLGLYPIPALHGLTTGELALAIRGQGWLDGLDQLDLVVIELEGWDRSQRWTDTGLAWSAPSPGLPDAELSLLYPATVLLEATTVSFGRGTDRPFGQFGASWLDAEALVAELEAIGLPGIRFEPTRFRPADQTEAVPAVRLEVTDGDQLRPLAVGVHLMARLLAQAGDRPIIDRPDHFDLLAGTPQLRRDLVAGRDPADIVASWSDDLDRWEQIRSAYLLYGTGGA